MPSVECGLELSTSEDIVICEEQTIQLEGDIDGDYFSFNWTSDHGYFNDWNLNPSVFIDNAPCEFTLTALAPTGTNLIDNGDFESGNIGFTTDYTIGSFSCYGLGHLDCEGTYDIITNPALGHGSWSSCGDHTSGNGNMMVVNGAANLQDIWCQEIDVEADTWYNFTAWAMSAHPSSPGILQFSIDGELIGNNFTLSSTTCVWEEFNEVWYSSTSETVTICITNQNFSAGGNDFCIDDIAFYELCSQEQSFIVELSEFELDLDISNDLNCVNDEAELYVEADEPGNYTFNWSTDDGEIISNTDNSSIIVSSEGNYSVTVTNGFGCEVEIADFVLDDSQEIDIDIYGDLILGCQDEGTEINLGTNALDPFISWYNQDGDLLETGDEIFIDQSGDYYVIVYDESNGCENLVEFEIVPDIDVPEIQLEFNHIDCDIDTATIIINVNSQDGWQTTWTDQNAQLHSGDTLEVNIGGTYHYHLITDSACEIIDSILIEENNELPEFEITGDQILDCRNPEVVLGINNSTEYVDLIWTNDQGDIISGDSIIVDSEGIYQAEVVNEFGCRATETISVTENFQASMITLQSDTLNCFREETELIIENPDGVDICVNGVDYPFGSGPIILSEGSYEVIAKSDNGCADTIMYTMPIDTIRPQVEINIGDITCFNPKAQLSASPNPDVLSFNWFNLNGQVIAQGTNAEIEDVGTYILIAVADNGCTTTYEFDVVEDIEIPKVDFDQIDLSCQNETAIYSALGGLENYNYEWVKTGVTISDSTSISVTDPGNYFLTVTDTINGCQFDTLFQIADNRILIDSINMLLESECGVPIAQLSIQEIFGGTPDYDIFVNNENLSGQFSTIDPGESMISIIDAEGCQLDTTITFEDIPPLILKQFEDADVDWPEELVYEVETNRDDSEISNIEWQPTGYFDCADCFEQSFIPEQSLQLSLFVTDIFGCRANTSAQINVEKKVNIFFPNIMTVANGGSNDHFYPIGSVRQVEEVEYLGLFDRWGAKVFENEAFQMNDPDSGWNGIFNGQSAAQGVYTYFARIRLINNEIVTFAGNVTLVR